MIQSGLLTALSPLLYRQSVILAELARMCDRLAQSERNISLRFRAIELARLSLKWIEATDTQPGQQDYETHIRGLVDSNMLLAELLLQSTDAEVVVMPSADMTQSRILEGFSLALNGLKWSEKLVAESERMRSNQLGSSLELLQKTCLDVSILLSAVTNKSLIEEYVQIYELSCGKYQLSSPS